MSNNPLLIDWVKNKEDDSSPYYFSKLDFLKIYGKKCMNQNKYGDCSTANTEDECISRDLKCRYTNNQCIKIIDSICNYYEEDGNPIYIKWTSDQVEYIDNLYKLAVSFEYGKFMDGNNYMSTIKTNAFQRIYSKFNITLESVTYNKRGCYYSIRSKLKQSKIFISQIKEHRQKSYNAIYSKTGIYKNDSDIKPVEISLYVFELLREKYTQSKISNLFYHDETIDEEIYEILNQKGICINNSNIPIGGNVKEIPLNLMELSPSDFEYNENIPGSCILWNLSNRLYQLLGRMTFQSGKLAMTIFKCILNTRYYINQKLSVLSEWSSILLFILLILDFIFKSLTLVSDKTVSFEENPLLFIINQYAEYFSAFKYLTFILPYLRILQLILSTFICVLIPITNLSYIEELVKELFNQGETVEKTGYYMNSKLKTTFNIKTILTKDNNMGKVDLFIQRFIEYAIQELYEGVLETQINCSGTGKINKKMEIYMDSIPKEYVSPIFMTLKNGFDNLQILNLSSKFPAAYSFVNSLRNVSSENNSNTSNLIGKIFGVFESIFLVIFRQILNQPASSSGIISETTNVAGWDTHTIAKESVGYLITSIQVFFTSPDKIRELNENNYIIYNPVSFTELYKLLLEKNVILSVALFAIINTYKNKEKYQNFIKNNIATIRKKMDISPYYTKSIKRNTLQKKTIKNNR